jgi:hypothetical protein
VADGGPFWRKHILSQEREEKKKYKIPQSPLRACPQRPKKVLVAPELIKLHSTSSVTILESKSFHIQIFGGCYPYLNYNN